MGRDDKGDASAHVLDAAERVFLERGYAGTRLRDLADALGMKPASLYHHAPGGKRELWQRVVTRALDRHREGLRRAARDAGPDLGARLTAMAAWLLGQPPVNVVAVAAADVGTAPGDEAHHTAERLYEALMVPVAEVYQEAQARRGARPDVAADLFVRWPDPVRPDPLPAMLTRSRSKPRRYRWWHAVAVGLAANAASAAPTGFNGDEAFYNDLDTPPGAPPDWLFPLAWAFNNATTLWSNLRVANLPPETPGRRTALVLEGASWGLFASFTSLYFGLRSPVLGAVNTVAGFGATAASSAITARLDRRAAWALVPRLAWLGSASYVAVGTALRNRDALLGWSPAQTETLVPGPPTGRSDPQAPTDAHA